MSVITDHLAERVSRLRSRVVSDGLDAFVVTGPGSVRWLTGYGGSNGLCIVTASEQRFLTDFRYGSRVAHLRESWDVQVVDQNLMGVIGEQLPAMLGDARRVGFEATRLTYANWVTLDEAARASGRELVATTNLPEEVRAVKAPDEIALIRAGAEINDRVYEWLASEGLDGTSERDWQTAIADKMRELGGDGAAFDALVASGANGASPHAVPGSEPIARNTLVVLDLGARVGGYCSDCTRTFATGSHGRRDARGLRGRAARAGGRARARQAGHVLHRGARDRQARDLRRGLRRLLQSRNRPRRRRRDPRGAALPLRVRRPARGRATSSPSSPGCTFPSDSESGSRISSSSPRTATRC